MMILAIAYTVRDKAQGLYSEDLQKRLTQHQGPRHPPDSITTQNNTLATSRFITPRYASKREHRLDRHS